MTHKKENKLCLVIASPKASLWRPVVCKHGVRTRVGQILEIRRKYKYKDIALKLLWYSEIAYIYVLKEVKQKKSY